MATTLIVRSNGLVVASFTLTANGATAAESLGSADTITVQVTGTFGGGTLSVQCSNDGTTWAALPTALSFTTAGVGSVVENSLGFQYYRLNLSGATSPNLSVTVVAAYRSRARL